MTDSSKLKEWVNTAEVLFGGRRVRFRVMEKPTKVMMLINVSRHGL